MDTNVRIKWFALIFVLTLTPFLLLTNNNQAEGIVNISGLRFTIDNVSWNFGSSIVVENFANGCVVITDPRCTPTFIQIQPTPTNEFRTYELVDINRTKFSEPITVDVSSITQTEITMTIASGGRSDIALLVSGTEFKKVEFAGVKEPKAYFDNGINYILIEGKSQVTLYFPDERKVDPVLVTAKEVILENKPQALSDRQIDFIINTFEVFNPDTQQLDLIIQDLKSDRISVADMLINVQNGVYGNDPGLLVGADFLESLYLAEAGQIEDFADTSYSKGVQELRLREAESGKDVSGEVVEGK